MEVQPAYTYTLTDGWLDGRMEELTDGRTNGWMDGMSNVEVIMPFRSKRTVRKLSEFLLIDFSRHVEAPGSLATK